MKTIVSEKSLRIDRMKINYRQIVNLPLGFSFANLKSIPGSTDNGHKVTVTRNGITAQICRVRDLIYLEHFEFLNGCRLLRDAVGIPARYSSQRSTDGDDNFLPISSVNPDCIPDFWYSFLPEIIEEQSRAGFANMTSSIGTAIRAATSADATIYPSPKDRALTMKAVEGAVDILIPRDYDLLNDYNFVENLATLGVVHGLIWDTDKTHGDPGEDAPEDCWTIHGKIHRFGTPFAIYIKDKNNKDYWQVRFELRPKGHSLRQTFGGMTFLLDGDDKRLAVKFKSFLQQHVLPMAIRLFDLDYPAISKGDRDQLWRLRVAQLPTRNGYNISDAQAGEISQHLAANDLTIRPSQFNTAVQESLRASDLFVPTDSKGLLCVNRRGLRGLARP